jgi:hypothetical protein
MKKAYHPPNLKSRGGGNSRNSLLAAVQVEGRIEAILKVAGEALR